MTYLFIVFNTWRSKRADRQFSKCVENEIAQDFLTLLLKVMSLAFRVNPEYRRNIDGFTGRYQFRSANNKVKVAAMFTGKGLKVKRGRLIKDPDVTVIFKDGKSIMNYLRSYLLGMGGDVLKLVLKNEVVIKGNVNYVYRFFYMANHVQLALTGRLP
jgi:hypothetical protein